MTAFVFMRFRFSKLGTIRTVSQLRSLSTIAPINIQSHDYCNLLDIIDKLRSQGLGRYVDLPQIIVCGDQSSGKSSVLEAISGLSFPTKDSLCTRFATELILRRHSEVSVRVSIVPHHSHNESEREKLLAFTAEVDPQCLDVGPVVEAATVAMGLTDVGGVDNGDDEINGTAASNIKRFSNDVLRVELSGPTQQHLTLVDLPGFFQAGNAEQSAHEARVVRKLVLKYMKLPRSIILAVVSAAYDFANQAVTQHARQVDPSGSRTMGLITKPDKLDCNSDSERAFVKMADNRDVVLQLGWHVLKNRDFKMRDAMTAERDAAEAEFFASSGSAWTAINPAHLGISALRPRLSTVLKNQIISQLPTLLQDIDALLDESNQGLARLGAPRTTILELRQYLSRVSEGFTRLMDAAVNGDYKDTAFFGNISEARGGGKGADDGEDRSDVVSAKSDANVPDNNNNSNKQCYYRRLRAVVQNRLTQFAEDMRVEGKTRQIIDSKNTAKRNRRTVLRADYIDEVKEAIARSRGRELPGTFNPLVVGDLFRSQCQPWERLMKGCIDSVLSSSLTMIIAALEHVAMKDIASKIVQSYIGPVMEVLKQDVVDQAAILMLAQREGHPITYNHYLTENVQKARNERLKASVENTLGKFMPKDQSKDLRIAPSALLHQLMSDIEPDMERVAASDTIDYIEAYYKVAVKRVVDDVGILVLEQCLISKLPALFTSDMVYDIPDDEVAWLAGETNEAAAERAWLTQKKATLESALRELHGLNKRHLQTPSITLTN